MDGRTGADGRMAGQKVDDDDAFKARPFGGAAIAPKSQMVIVHEDKSYVLLHGFFPLATC